MQNNKLGYADSENGVVKRELNVIGSTVSEVANQIDQSTGTRVVLTQCFCVDAGYGGKFTLCAPSFDELRDWTEVLTQNSMAETAEKHDEASSQLDVADVAGKLEGVAGKHHPAEEKVPEVLMPYTAMAVKE